jgi:transglutaminase-like putative cysteine protease
MIHNFEYDYECEPIIQYFNVKKNIKTQKGICYDFSHLFAALCRSQNIPCYVIDGDKCDNAQYHHTWNRVYFDGSWWNIDVTFDTVQTRNQGELYGFCKIDNAFTTDKEYLITGIY